MRFTHTLPLVLALGLAACSGDSKETAATFTDPVAAMDQADAAAASDNVATAQAGYEYAAANGDAKLQGDALLALVNLHLDDSNEEGAMAAFDRLKADHADHLTGDGLLKLCDAAVAAAMPDAGDEMVAYALATFPDLKEKLGKPAAAFEAIRTNGPGVDLSGLGYAGD
ncbi:MAG: hypothetical protein O3A95_04855 [Planctomycetota bacterium]|nr:hypothetical protein [Planctomycetota bacterium]MDA1113613.1 hypothetical protein [Planctomycetota bacterium]